MDRSERPIIAGAGPVVLGTALFLAIQGCPTRLIEMKSEPSKESKPLRSIPALSTFSRRRV
jgi:2-polyprenyl-6-methoxyphenol hydroxylase-like FAD-dependent oxidoreductase